MLRGLDPVKTLFSIVSASLSRVTRADQCRSCLERLDFLRLLAMRGVNANKSHVVPSLAWVSLRLNMSGQELWD